MTAPSRPLRLAFAAYRRSPAPLRRLAVRLGSPSYTVGAVCVLACGDAILVLRQRHRSDWGLPGGLLKRGESPEDAVRRELREEIGLEVAVGVPAACWVVPAYRRIDVIYSVELASRVEVSPRGEALQARWVRPDELGPEDALTLGALDALARAAAPGATAGRLAG